MFLRRSNRGTSEGIEAVVKWLLYIAIAIVAGIAIMRIVGRFS